MKRLFSSVGVLAILAVLAGAVFAPSRSAAEDAPGCEGLGDYRAEMFKAGRDFLALLDERGVSLSKDPFSYSTDDWIAYAESSLEFQRDLKEITPPAWAAEWHQAKVDLAAIAEQLGKAAEKDGVLAVLMFGDALEKNEAEGNALIATISATCADFQQFTVDWDALDGNIKGTPVATPSA